jgi:hypothetical protein
MTYLNPPTIQEIYRTPDQVDFFAVLCGCFHPHNTACRAKHGKFGLVTVKLLIVENPKKALNLGHFSG